MTMFEIPPEDDARWSSDGCGGKRFSHKKYTFYRSADGRPASMAYGGSWISALFDSVEAAVSWAGHLNEAEEKWAELRQRYDPDPIPHTELLGVRRS